mgnify:CR=1 FL=1
MTEQIQHVGSCTGGNTIPLDDEGRTYHFGCKEGEVANNILICSCYKLAEEISKLDNLRVKGLMAVAPYVENAEDNRHYFQKIRELSVDIARENIDNVSMGVLSMGMTGDYTVAIEEGATIVRVGTGIFGARTYAANAK